MNKIVITEIQHNDKEVVVDYKCSESLKKYFIDTKNFFSSYDFNTKDIPDSIAVIPFISNILPIIWVCNARLLLDELDKDFYEHLIDIKQGYQEMYPKIEFLGEIKITKLVDNKLNNAKQTACLFSGGVDAFSTLFSHIKECPKLITIWGADIKLDDYQGWDKVTQHLKSVASDYQLNYECVKSNFRTFINEAELNDLIGPKSNDSWWHGFQHGIGLLGLTAPIAYEQKLKTIYIASSFTEKDKGLVTCASDPTIDNHVYFGSCNVYHDGYDMTRQMKIQHIVKTYKETQVPIRLRVCWESEGGDNCCKCEKCYRTIMGIIAEGENPNMYGFHVDPKVLKRIRIFIKYHYMMSPILLPLWKDIQIRAVINKDRLYEKSHVEWILDCDFNRLSLIRILKRIKGYLVKVLKI